MNYLSLFSGIGTAEKGIEQAYEAIRRRKQILSRTDLCGDISGERKQEQFQDGNVPRSQFNCIGFAEIDRYAASIYSHHWPAVKNYGDATRIVCDELPDFDFLVGGFPCQSFSIAGKRQGFNEARGTLFFEIARILSHKRPRHFLLENVKGLLSADDGKVYATILRILADLDYRMETVVLNSKHYGVPQNRERVFFIGHLGDGCCGETLSFGDGDGEAFQPGYVGAVSGTISTKNQSGQCQFDGSTTLIAIPVLTPDRSTKRQNGRRFKENGESAFTLTSQDRHGVMVQAVDTKNVGAARFTNNVASLGANDYKEPKGVMLTDKRIRRLTPTECERLQGLPDDFTKYGIDAKGEWYEVSDFQRYKTLGNAMTVNVIEAIITRMIEKGCLV